MSSKPERNRPPAQEEQPPEPAPGGKWYGAAQPEFSEGRAGQHEPGEQRDAPSHAGRGGEAASGERRRYAQDRARDEARHRAPDAGASRRAGDPASDDGLLQTPEADDHTTAPEPDSSARPPQSGNA